MSTKAATIIQKVERGERIKEIRVALGMTGDEFAAELTTRAKVFGYPATYERAKVSRIESGGRKLTVEELAIILEMDPERRSLAWLVFGTAKLGNVRPRPQAKTPAASSGKSR